MKLYLCGPMSGLPEYGYPAFHDHAFFLRAQGHVVVNPAEMFPEPEGVVWTAALREDLKALLDCECVAVLPGWRQSRGAALEVHVARTLQMPILDARTLERVAE